MQGAHIWPAAPGQAVGWELGIAMTGATPMSKVLDIFPSENYARRKTPTPDSRILTYYGSTVWNILQGHTSSWQSYFHF